MKQISHLTTLCLAALLSACASTQDPRYYSLNGAADIAASTSPQVRVIEVMPVGLPDRLNRSQIVIQDAAGQSVIQDQARWTSPLSLELRDVLSGNLQRSLGAVDRYSGGLSGDKAVYRIATDFSRFDIMQSNTGQATQQLTNKVAIAVAWVVQYKVANSSANFVAAAPQLSCRMQFDQAIKAEPSIRNMVNASREAVTQVSQAIAATVNAIGTNTTPQLQYVTCE